MLNSSYYEKMDEIISNYPLEERSLIPIIQDVQNAFNYLPPELLTYISKKLEFQTRVHIVLQAFTIIFLLKQRENM